VRRYLDRKTLWRLVKKYCLAAGIDSHRFGSRGIGAQLTSFAKCEHVRSAARERVTKPLAASRPPCCGRPSSGCA
jgi:hypothetical protein